MGGISNDNILKFVLGISGIGLSLASFTLSRVFALEEYAHSLSEKIGIHEVQILNNEKSTDSLDTAQREFQRDRLERRSIIESRIAVIDQMLRDLKDKQLPK